MSDEMEIEVAGSLDAPEAAALEVVGATLETFLDTASVDRVYGEPVEHGETVIIPTSEVLVALGFGAGFGGGVDENEQKVNRGGGGGGGGGGRVLARPVAVIVSTPEGVRVQEVLDPTKIILAAITATGFMLAMVMRMSRPKRMLRALKD